MKVIKALIVATAFGVVSAHGLEPVKSEMTCEQLGEVYEATAEAKERFADLAGSCEGVYDINGKMYVRSGAVVRRVLGNSVTLYLPQTNHTFKVDADPDGRVYMGNQKVRPRDLKRGDEIGIYLSVDEFGKQKVQEIALATHDDHAEEIVVAPVETVEALPTTG
jgi:hypothetical protein